MVLPSSKLCIASMNAEVKAPGQGLILPSRLLVYKATLRLML